MAAVNPVMPEPTMATSVRFGGTEGWRSSWGAARHQKGSKEAVLLNTLLPKAMGQAAFP